MASERKTQVVSLGGVRSQFLLNFFTPLPRLHVFSLWSSEPPALAVINPDKIKIDFYQWTVYAQRDGLNLHNTEGGE